MDRFHEAVSVLESQNSWELGWQLSSVRHSVTVTNHDERKQIQEAVEQLAQGLAIVYLFAIFEDFFSISEIKSNHNELEMYLAYRHIRHSFAHKKTWAES